MLLDLLENLVQWRFLSSGGCVPRLHLAWACVTARRAVLMGGSPAIPHIHKPGALTELADLSHIHPVPTIPHGDFIVRAGPDAFSTLLQDHIFSGTDRPFPQPLLSV